MAIVTISGLQKTREQILSTTRGFITESFPGVSNVTTLTLVTGELRGALVGLRAGDVVTNVHFNVTTAGTSVTVGRAGVYSTAGVLLASCANTTTIWTDTAGMRTVALTTPYSVTADGGYFVCFLPVFSGTAPQVSRGASTSNQAVGVNGGVSGAAFQGSQADLPAPATFAASGTVPWIAVS